MYERILLTGRCYQITYGPDIVHITALTGLAWDVPQYTHTYKTPNEMLRPLAEWQAHIRETENKSRKRKETERWPSTR